LLGDGVAGHTALATIPWRPSGPFCRAASTFWPTMP
jgi:hypothetical protein